MKSFLLLIQIIKINQFYAFFTSYISNTKTNFIQKLYTFFYLENDKLILYSPKFQKQLTISLSNQNIEDHFDQISFIQYQLFISIILSIVSLFLLIITYFLFLVSCHLNKKTLIIY